MENAEAETGTEQRAGGAGRPKAHPIGAAAAAAVGGLVTAGLAPTKEENNNDAGYTPAHSTGAAPSALVGGPVSVRPSSLIGAAQRREGGDDIPKSRHEGTDTSDKATEESPPPPNGYARLTRAAEGWEGRGGIPTQQRAPMARSEGAGWDP